MAIGCLVHVRVPFLRAMGRSRLRFCSRITGAGSKIDSGVEFSSLESDRNGKFKSVIGKEEEGTEEGLPEAFG